MKFQFVEELSGTKSFRNERAHFYTHLSGVSCAPVRFIPGQQKKTARPRMFRHDLPSRGLRPLAPLKRLSPVGLPASLNIKSWRYLFERKSFIATNCDISNLPKSERIGERIICLPIHPAMTNKEKKYISQQFIDTVYSLQNGD